MKEKKGRRAVMIAGGCLAALCIGGGVWARTRTEVTNHLTTGVVDIDLREYKRESGQEVAWEGIPVVLPGMEVSKIPRITNHGNDCYVRAKLDFTGLAEDLAKELEQGIYGWKEGWQRAGDGYYYYTEVLSSEQGVDLFQGLEIPADFPESEAGKTFQLHIQADAIQSANVSPGFAMDNPWGQVKILECQKEGTYDLSLFQKADNQKFAVVFEGNTEKLFTQGKDFFENFPVLLPGDTYSDSATLRNDSRKPVKLYFHTEQLEDSPLLDQIGLTIGLSGSQNKEIYEGKLRAERLGEDLLLATIPAGESLKLDFTLELPAELDNSYSLSGALVKWVFAADPESSYGVPQVDTGDYGQTERILVLIIVAGLAGAGLAILSVRGKGREGMGKNRKRWVRK